MLQKKTKAQTQKLGLQIPPEGDKDGKRCRRAARTDLLRQEGDDLRTDGVQPLGDLGLTGGENKDKEA